MQVAAQGAPILKKLHWQISVEVLVVCELSLSVLRYGADGAAGRGLAPAARGRPQPAAPSGLPDAGGRAFYV